MSDLLRESTDVRGKFHSWLFYCPGCKQAHAIDTRWQFDGDWDKPTFSPSLLTQSPQIGRCHLFIRTGLIEYLSDCTHELAGTTVPMEPFKWEADDDERA